MPKRILERDMRALEVAAAIDLLLEIVAMHRQPNPAPPGAEATGSAGGLADAPTIRKQRKARETRWWTRP